MKTIVSLLFVFGTFFLTHPLIAETTGLEELLPPKSDKTWKVKGEIKQAKGQELFMLINGGAMLYLQLGFNQVLMATLTNSSGQLINLDVFEMNSAEIAEQLVQKKIGESPETLDIGSKAYFEDYYINFYQEKYQVTISGADASEKSRQGVIDLAKLVSERITAVSE